MGYGIALIINITFIRILYFNLICDLSFAIRYLIHDIMIEIVFNHIKTNKINDGYYLFLNNLHMKQ